MPAAEVQWEPAIAALAGGLVIGLLAAWWLRRRAAASAPSAAVAAPLELRDLDGRVAALVVQLRELEDAAAKRTPEQLARERYALELEAARALQSRDTIASRLGAFEPKAAAAAAPVGAARGFVWGAATSAAMAFLVFLVWQSAERRPEGGSPTGGPAGMSRGPAPAASGSSQAEGAAAAADDAHTTELRQRLTSNPDDLDARVELARHLLSRRDLMGVWNETQYVLERQPGHPRALAYQSLVRLAMGQGDMAVAMLKQAIAAAPELIEARENLAFVYASQGRAKDAAAVVDDVARRSPEDAERLRQALAQLAESREKQGASPESASAHEGVPPPAADGESRPGAMASARAPAAASVPRAAAPAGGGVFGWIEADAAVAARVAPGSVIFLTVRPAGVAQGPPVAVKRLESGRFPLQFEVGSGDSMMGQALPDRMRIDVRADSDGDPMTRPPTDPKGYADDVALGRTGVRVTLK